MKIVFKEYNYVTNIRKTKDLDNRIKIAGDDQKRLARIIMNEFEVRTEDHEIRRHIFFYSMTWGILYILSRSFGLIHQNEFTELIDPIMKGFTAICATSGIASYIGTYINSKKSSEMFDLIKKMDEDKQNNMVK